MNLETIISINEVPLGTEGNLLCVTGSEGSGKTNYVGSLIAGALTKDNSIDTIATTVQMNTDKKAILLYDTEQSTVQLHKNTKRVLRRCQLNSQPDYF